MESSSTAITPGPDSVPRWDSLVIPAGWEPVAALCRQITEDPDGLVDRIISAIRAELPAYRETTPISDPDLRASVVTSLGLTLVGIAERRSPRAEELRARGDLGARRADQRLAVDSLLQAFLIGYRLLWDELVARSPGTGRPRPRPSLVGRGDGLAVGPRANRSRGHRLSGSSAPRRTSNPEPSAARA